jgi:hypothetical protein
MSRDDVIRMAKKAGFVCDEADFVFQKPGRVGIQLELERFANLVRADEREACAKVCEALNKYMDDGEECAAAIRNRGNT